MKISYGITVYNEADELERLIELLIQKTDPEDEIVICVERIIAEFTENSL